MRMTFVALPGALLFFAANIETARACADGSLGQFQVYVKRNISAYCSDYQGTVGAGGTVTLGKFSINAKKAGKIGLRAGGNVSVFETAIEGGAETFKLTQVRSAVRSLSSKTSHGSIGAQMDCLSAWLAKGIAQPVGGPSSPKSQFASTKVGLYFFSMTHQELAARMPLTFNFPAGSMVVVNVTGTGVASLKARPVMATPTIPVVFNFVEATGLAIDAIEIAGTFLAPKADVTFSNGLLKGALYANSLTGGKGFLFSSSAPAAAAHCAATTANQAGQINTVAAAIPPFLACR